ncbi:MAG: DUF2160 domain-containing protein [Inquilinaceae bacterium]
MEWMAWTTPVAIFFGAIALLLVAMTLWQAIAPGTERRGFLPMSTTRGDRLFIGLLGAAYIHLIWLAATDMTLWIALALAAVWMLVVMRWG